MVIFRKRVAQLTERALAMFVGRACRAAGLAGDVHVLVTTNREMRSLNSRFRRKDKPTDVLSFPAEPNTANRLAGDLAISGEIAAANARLLGHSPAEEVKILALHGVLHLAGYDHERDAGEMARREQRLRKAFHLPLSLSERNDSSRKTPVSLDRTTPGSGSRSKRRSTR